VQRNREETMRYVYALMAGMLVSGALAAVGCDDDETTPAPTTTSPSGTQGGGGTGGTAGTGGTGGTGGTAGTGGGGGIGGGGGSAPIFVGNNYTPTCADYGYLTPYPSEYSHRSAARLTPPYYPFEVQAIRYEIGNSSTGDCDTALEHLVEVFKDTATTPAATPTVLASFTTNTGVTDPPDTVRTIEETLATPVTLETDEHLYVAVEMAGDGGSGLAVCVSMCLGVPGDADRNFWSNAATTPYSWATLASFGMSENIRIGMIGM
jgi:hypothetical protein